MKYQNRKTRGLPKDESISTRLETPEMLLSNNEIVPLPQPSSVPSDTTALDAKLLREFEQLAPGVSRNIYVDQAISSTTRATLKTRGYDVVNLKTMARDEPIDFRTYILAYSQAMLDGTVEVDDDKRKILELEAKMNGLLVQKTMNLNFNAKSDADIKDLLNSIGQSRYLIKNTTVEKVEQAKRASLIPGEKFSDE